MPDVPSTDGPEGDRSRLPSDPETLKKWLRVVKRRYLDAKEERDQARKALQELRMTCNVERGARRTAQQENERLRKEYERIKDVLHSMYEMLERAPSTRSAAELRADELEQENDRLRSELNELKEANASDYEADTAECMAGAVAEAARRGRRWETGAALRRWLSDRFPLSTRTVERRLDGLGLWIRPGKRGHAGKAVRETVENCLEHAGFSI